jgi:hypothetical protein
MDAWRGFGFLVLGFWFWFVVLACAVFIVLDWFLALACAGLLYWVSFGPVLGFVF